MTTATNPWAVLVLRLVVAPVVGLRGWVYYCQHLLVAA